MRAEQAKNEELVNKIYDIWLIDLRDTIIKNETLENEKPNKTVNIVEKIIYLNKGKGIKLSTSKQMLQRLPMVLAQVDVGDASENLLNEIRQIIYSLYWVKRSYQKSIQQYNNKTINKDWLSLTKSKILTNISLIKMTLS